MELVNELAQHLRTVETGPRSHITQIRTAIIERGLELDAAQIIVDRVATSLKSMTPVNKTSLRIILSLHHLVEYREEVANATMVKAGLECIHWLAELGVISAKKQNMVVKNKVKPHWMLSSESKDYTEYAATLEGNTFKPSPLLGPLKWTGTTMHFDNCQVDIVKKARKDKMLHHYTPHRMPLVYSSMNRLNEQTYTINQRLLEFATDEQEHTFIPDVITADEIKDAMRSLNDVVRRALRFEEAQFIEHNKWEDDGELQPERKLTKNIRKYIDVGSVDHKKVIQKHSKRFEYEQIINLAHHWGTAPLNFLYTCDTRGRIYAEQNFLNPLGADLAKALLMFQQEDVISAYDLCLHISNCCGNDKASFDDRVRWVNDHSEELYHIGTNPWGNWHLIEELGINREKTLWQALAALIEYVRYCDHINSGTDEPFYSGLPIGLDSTSSGTQILTMLTKDSEVAPYVNLTKSPTGVVGDFYTYLADHCHNELLDQELSETLQEFTSPDVWPKVKRNVAKRNSMTYNYSGTRYGFGTQHLDDKSSYGKLSTTTALGDMLTHEDCYMLGSVMFDTCEKYIRGSAEIMEFLREGAGSVPGHIISWELPDGFTAYQRCAKVRSSKGVSGMVGDTKVTLKVEILSEDADTYLHKNGMAANWTHSLDSYLLREIVRGMPLEAPISTVHDQFSTSTYYVADLQEVAREAYKTCANRDMAAETCADAFGYYRELPEVGDWTIDQLNESEFFIC